MSARTASYGALDAAALTLAEVDHLAGLVRDVLAGRPGGPPTWVLSHWVEHEPDVGGAHLALSVAAPCRPEDLWEGLREVVAAWVGGGHVGAAAAELGVAVDDRAQGLAPLQRAARDALARHAARASGRAVCFPGADALPDVLSAADLVAASAIEEVVGVGGAAVAAAAAVHTFGHVRPVFRDARLVLPVVSYGHRGDLTPYEVREPTPCCAAH